MHPNNMTDLPTEEVQRLTSEALSRARELYQQIAAAEIHIRLFGEPLSVEEVIP